MRNVWTVARHTLAESVRMKVAVFFIAILAVLVVGLPFASKGDGTVSGAVQSFLSYSIAAASFLLSCLTIFLAKSLSDDLVGKQILTLMTKPLARWEYVLGKWVGVILLDLGLLAASGVVIYAMTLYLAGQRVGLIIVGAGAHLLAYAALRTTIHVTVDWRSARRRWLGKAALLPLAVLLVAGYGYGLAWFQDGSRRSAVALAVIGTPAALLLLYGVVALAARWPRGARAGAVLVLGALVIPGAAGLPLAAAARHQDRIVPRDEVDADRLENEILQARHGTRAILPEEQFKAAAEAQFEQNLEQGVYATSEHFDSVRQEKEKERLRQENEKRWRSVWPHEQRAFDFADVRCDRAAESTLHVKYKYRVYSYPPDEIIRCFWVAGNREQGTPEYVIPRRDVMDRRHTLPIPADTVDGGNNLRVVFVNANPFVALGEEEHPSTIVFEGPDAVEILFAVSSFGSNLVRALTLVMCRLAFLAAVAVAATTVLSFPVASLVSLAVYVLAASRGFLGESVNWIPDEGVAGVAEFVLGNLLRAVYFVIPDFAAYDGLGTLVEGRNVTLMWVLLGLGRLLVLKAGVVLLVGCLLFQRREVSEVSI